MSYHVTLIRRGLDCSQMVKNLKFEVEVRKQITVSCLLVHVYVRQTRKGLGCGYNSRDETVNINYYYDVE